MKAGLVSISFRKHSPEEIVRGMTAAGLSTIEWGGDIHVLPGTDGTARRIERLGRDAGVNVAAYGSYHYAGHGGDFGAVLATAASLRAPVVRVWAGRQSSRGAAAEYRTEVLHELGECAERAARYGIKVATEFHADTLADSAEACHKLLAEIAHPNLRTYWQPPHGLATPAAVDGLRTLLPWIEHVHVFHWWPGPGERHPLRLGSARWSAFMRELCVLPATPHTALLEFMPHDSLTELEDEAAALRELLFKSASHS